SRRPPGTREGEARRSQAAMGRAGGRPAAPARRHRRAAAPRLAAQAAAAALLAALAPRPWPGPPRRPPGTPFAAPPAGARDAAEVAVGPLPGRRRALAAASVGLVPLSGGAPPAQAEQGWQLSLPRSWKVFSQTAAPPPGAPPKPTALVVAGDIQGGGEMTVLRVPLSTAPGAPDPEGARRLIEYFETPVGVAPKVDKAQAVEVVSSSQRQQVGLTDFQMLGQPNETIKDGRRYLSYEFENSVCLGNVVESSNGRRCERSDAPGEALEFFSRRHVIKLTVSDEGVKGPGKVSYLWMLDSSGPAGEKFQDVAEVIDTLKSTFQLGDEQQLERDRTVELTPSQLEALKSQGLAGT
ncbi:unnamed protein product, partial [Prorocentrum cordatum]